MRGRRVSKHGGESDEIQIRAPQGMRDAGKWWRGAEVLSPSGLGTCCRATSLERPRKGEGEVDCTADE